MSDHACSRCLSPIAICLNILLLMGAAILAGVLTLHEPALGDDFYYWRLAYGLHTVGGDAWGLGFHALRWPVWGMSWMQQLLLGYGPASYYGVPLLYLAFGAALVFLFTLKLFNSPGAAWTAGLVLIFHPILDPSITRPMPDLPEGVWTAAAFFCWLQTMTVGQKRWRVVFAALTGLALAVAYANRITGAFVVPALIFCTLLFYRQRFGWLLLAGGFTIFFIALEGLLYLSLTGDFLHSINANLGARGRKGTEPVELLQLPFRFVHSLWDDNLLKRLLNLLAALGAYRLWKSREPDKRSIVIWGLMIYLCYSCGLQSFDPPRPLVRDGDRFIAGLAFPLAIMSAAALFAAWQFMLGRTRGSQWRPGAWQAAALGLVGFAVLYGLSQRDPFNTGFMGAMRQYLKTVPEGAFVLAETEMKDLSMFVNPRAGNRINWLTEDDMLNTSESLETVAGRADYVFFNRKSIWTRSRKKLERHELQQQPALASFLQDPLTHWQYDAVFAKDKTPDLTFLRRRPAGADRPSEVAAADLLPHLNLPLTWKFSGKQKETLSEIPIPPAWRGRMARLDARAAANTVEAVSLRLRFSEDTQYNLKPYLYPETGREFFSFQIPVHAESLEVRVAVTGMAEWIRLEELRLRLDAPPAVTIKGRPVRASDDEEAPDS